MCEKETKNKKSEKKVKNKKLVLNLFQDYKEVKQGGNNETKKGLYPY